MTDLSTKNLQRLLDEAAPGPWEALATYDDGAPRPDTTREMRAAGEYLGMMHTPNAELAALALPLAQEMILLRVRIEGLITAMENKAAAGESPSPATIASYLKEIVLGDHDG